MVDDTSTPSTESIDRRDFLAGVGAAGLAGLAGCGGDGNPGDGNVTQADQSTPAAGGDTQAPAGGTAGNGGGEGCPASPSSYERRPIPPGPDRDEPVVSVEAPASEAVTFSPTAVYVNHDPHRINVRVQVRTDTDVETLFTNPDLEVTDEYDLPSGARMWKQSQFDGQESATVYLPRGSDVVQVNTQVRSDECMDALRPIRDHMVNSLEVL